MIGVGIDGRHGPRRRPRRRDAARRARQHSAQDPAQRFAGIRLPWTMRNPANRQATNRLGGVLLMVGGLVMVVAALVTGQRCGPAIASRRGVVLSVIITTFYSSSPLPTQSSGLAFMSVDRIVLGTAALGLNGREERLRTPRRILPARRADDRYGVGLFRLGPGRDRPQREARLATG